MKRSKIITHYQEDTWCEEIQIPYGFSVLDSHPHAKWDGDTLRVGSMTVRVDEWEMSQLSGSIPVWLVARDFNGRFICGVDLMENGNIWSGHNGTEYSDPEEAFVRIMEHNKETGRSGFYSFSLSLEEPLALSDD
jgi:hypothetical protein